MTTTDRRGVIVSATDPAQASDPNPGLAIKAAVAVATTGVNIALAGLLVVDGYQTIAGDRVLVKDQADQTTNGIYTASSGNWTRTTDADDSTDFAPGLQVYVIGGPVNGGKTFKLTSASPIVLGTSLITWVVITYPKSALEWQFGGDISGGAVPLPGLQLPLEVPFGCNIVQVRLVADRVGSCQLDLWLVPFGTVPSVANSICAADLPTLTNAQFMTDVALAGWTVALPEGYLLYPNIVSASVLRSILLSVKLSRS